MGDDHDTRSDRVEQEPGGASVIPGCDQPDPPRPEIETDTGVRARPDIDGDDSSTSTSTNERPPTESIRVQPGMSQQAQGSDAESISIMFMHPPLETERVGGLPGEIPEGKLGEQELPAHSESTRPYSERDSPALSLLAQGEPGGISGPFYDPPQSREPVMLRSPEIPNLRVRGQELEEESRLAQLASEHAPPASTLQAQGDDGGKTDTFLGGTPNRESDEFQSAQDPKLKVRGQDLDENSPDEHVDPEGGNAPISSQARVGGAPDDGDGETELLKFEETPPVQIFRAESAPMTPSSYVPFSPRSRPDQSAASAAVPIGVAVDDAATTSSITFEDADGCHEAMVIAKHQLPQSARHFRDVYRSHLGRERGFHLYFDNRSRVQIYAIEMDLERTAEMPTLENLPYASAGASSTDYPAEISTELAPQGGYLLTSAGTSEAFISEAQQHNSGEHSSLRTSAGTSRATAVETPLSDLGGHSGSSRDAIAPSRDRATETAGPNSARNSTREGKRRSDSNSVIPPVEDRQIPRLNTNDFETLSKEGIMATLEEHVGTLGTMIVSLDPDENSSTGRNLARALAVNLKHLAHFGIEQRELRNSEVKDVERRLNRLTEIVEAQARSKNPNASGNADYVEQLELDLSVAWDEAEQIRQGWKEHTDELEQEVKEREDAVEKQEQAMRESKLLIQERSETQLEMLRGQLSEELGQKAQMEEALQSSQLQAATALSELEEEQRKAKRLGQQVREREGTIRGLRESQTSGGLDVTQRSLTNTREEEWQSLFDERTQEMETMSEQLAQLQKQVEFANTQSEMFRQTINTTKQSAQQQASALQQKFEAKFKKQNEARLAMLHSFYRSNSLETQADKEAWEASITARQDQDEVVSRLDDQLREARADAGRLREDSNQLKLTQAKLEQQLSAVKGQLSKESANKRQRIMELQNDLKATKGQLQVALDTGTQLRDQSVRVANHRTPRGDNQCDVPHHQYLDSQVQRLELQVRELQAEVARSGLRESKLRQERSKDAERSHAERETWHAVQQRANETEARLTQTLKAQREAAAAREKNLRSQLDGVEGPAVSVASPEQAVEFRSLQLAYRESELRNENLQGQMANLQVSLSEANGRVGELQARLSSQRQSSFQVQTSLNPSNGVSNGLQLPLASGGVHLDVEDRPGTCKGRFYAIHLHNLAESLVTRDVMRCTELMGQYPFCFVMTFLYEDEENNRSSQDYALQSAIQFLLQPGLNPDSPLLQSRGDPANLQGYVVRQGFMTGVTFNREVALAAQRGARNLSEWLFKPGHHQPEEPEQLTTPLIGIQSLFELDWYNLHCISTASTGMPWASSFPRMPEWVQLHNGVLSHQLQAVTAHLFRYGQPEPDFRWSGPTGLDPDEEEEEEEAPRSRLFEGLPVDSTPRAARSSRAAPSRARSTPISMSTTQPRVAIQTLTPGDRQFGEAPGQSSTRYSGPPPSKSSLRRSVPLDTGGSNSYSRSTSQLRGGNESDDDIASVTSATSIPEKAPPSVEEARMTKRQKERLLDNDLVKSKPKVVAAVKQVFVAPVAVDGATAVGEVKQLTVKPTILKVGSALYNKDADKCKGPERQIMKKELVKVLTAFPADQGQRGDWWCGRLGRQRIMRALKISMDSNYRISAIHEELNSALSDVGESVEWLRELNDQLNSIENLFFHQPWLYIEVYLFMCDEIAVPHSESVERWKNDWDNLKASTTLMETAGKVEELASKHLNENIQSLYVRKDVASKVHKKLLECLRESPYLKDRELRPWLTSELEDRLHADPTGWEDIPQGDREHALYNHRSIVKVAAGPGRKKETEMAARVEMQQSQSQPKPRQGATGRPPMLSLVAAIEDQPSASEEQNDPPQLGLPTGNVIAALPQTRAPAGTNRAISVGYLGEPRGRPKNGRGIIMQGFYQKHEESLRGYPGGEKGFQTALHSTIRDDLAKASIPNDKGNAGDPITAMLVAVACPYTQVSANDWKIDVKNPKKWQTQFGVSARRFSDPETDSFLPGACAHCFLGATFVPGKFEFLYAQRDKADSAHDWSDCPRVKAALFYWGEQLSKDPNIQQCYKGQAILKRLMFRNPDNGKFKLNGRLPCEVATNKDYVASEIPRAKRPGQ